MQGDGADQGRDDRAQLDDVGAVAVVDRRRRRRRHRPARRHPRQTHQNAKRFSILNDPETTDLRSMKGCCDARNRRNLHANARGQDLSHPLVGAGDAGVAVGAGRRAGRHRPRRRLHLLLQLRLLLRHLLLRHLLLRLLLHFGGRRARPADAHRRFGHAETNSRCFFLLFLFFLL